MYEPLAAVTVGVPDMTPVDESSDNPAGSPGLIENVVAVPPSLVGELSDIGMFSSYDAVTPVVYALMSGGSIDTTSTLNWNVVDPPVFVAVISKSAAPDGDASVVPEITPVSASIDKPVGSSGAA